MFLMLQTEVLDAAFERLEDEGILVGRDWPGPGHIMMRNWAETAFQEGKQVDGYVFYHRHDMERAIECGWLSLCYDRVAADSIVAIGDRIVNALREVGMQVEWDGRVLSRILVFLN